MNPWILLSLVVVVGAYIGLTVLADKKKKDGLKLSDLKNRKVSDDLKLFMEHFGKMFLYLLLIVIWLFRQIASIFKEFIDWFKKKETKAKKRNKEIFKKININRGLKNGRKKNKV